MPDSVSFLQALDEENRQKNSVAYENKIAVLFKNFDFY
jgi:hypothetical protein